MTTKERLDGLGLNPNNSIVIGSGIMGALGLREAADIDMVVSAPDHARLRQDDRFQITHVHGREILAAEPFEIGTSWEVLGHNRDFEQLNTDTVVVEGVRYVTPEFLLQVKQSWLREDDDVRPKDFKDADLLSRHLGAYQPRLILLYGPPAAGKLTVGKALAEMTGHVLVDNHRMLDYLAEIMPRTDPAMDAPRTVLGRRIRLAVFEEAPAAGVSLISTFAPLSAGMYDFMRAIKHAVESGGGRVHFVQLLPSHEAMARRVVEPSRKGRKIDNVELWQELTRNKPGAFEPLPDLDHLQLDNSDLSPEAAAVEIVKHVVSEETN